MMNGEILSRTLPREYWTLVLHCPVTINRARIVASKGNTQIFRTDRGVQKRGKEMLLFERFR
jgi:hypothetical protein